MRISEKTDETRCMAPQRLTLLAMRLQERVALRGRAMLGGDPFEILQSMDVVMIEILLEWREWHRFYGQARIEYRLRFGHGRARRHQGQRDPGQDRLHRFGRVLRCGQFRMERVILSRDDERSKGTMSCMLHVCEMRVGVSISATTSVKRTSSDPSDHLQLPSVNADRGAELVAPGRLGDDRRIRSPFCFRVRHSSEEILAQHRAQLVMNYGRPLRYQTIPRLHQTTFDAIWSILTFEIAAANPIDG
jgi:hypothetical protein